MTSDLTAGPCDRVMKRPDDATTTSAGGAAVVVAVVVDDDDGVDDDNCDDDAYSQQRCFVDTSAIRLYAWLFTLFRWFEC